jgi:hypothetical protein
VKTNRTILVALALLLTEMGVVDGAPAFAKGYGAPSSAVATAND